MQIPASNSTIRHGNHAHRDCFKFFIVDLEKGFNLADIYLFKVNNVNTRTMCEICSNFTIKTPERGQ